MEKKSFEELEKEIRKLQPLKFRIQTPKNYKETIKLVINGTPTYLNSNKTPQCTVNRARGLRDIYRTVLYYHPDISFKEVFNETCNTASGMFCDDTNQTVFTPLYGTKQKSQVQVRIGRTPYHIEDLFIKKNN